MGTTGKMFAKKGGQVNDEDNENGDLQLIKAKEMFLKPHDQNRHLKRWLRDALRKLAACFVTSPNGASIVINTVTFICKDTYNFRNMLFLKRMCNGCYTSSAKWY